MLSYAQKGHIRMGHANENFEKVVQTHSVPTAKLPLDLINSMKLNWYTFRVRNNM